jgi:ACT domain-containing protein
LVRSSLLFNRARAGAIRDLTAQDRRGAKVVLAKKLNADQTPDIDDVCKTPRVSRSTFYRYVRL